MSARSTTMLGVALAAAMVSSPAWAQISDDIVKIGVLTDMNGPASTSTGQGSVTAAQMVEHCSLCERYYHGDVEVKRSFLGRLFGKVAIKSILKDDAAYTEVFSKGDKRYYRARFAGLKESSAEQACKELQKSKMACFAVRN